MPVSTAAKLGERNLAYLHVIEPAGASSYAVDDVNVSATAHLKSLFKGTVITARGYTFESGSEVVARGAADLVAFGQLFLANPDLPERFRLNAPLNEPDPKTFYGGDERGYIDYPALKLETATAS